ncbi:histidine phosphatase family protein [Rhizomicrobium electricum]|jgi:probable phosphoglycerate mutase|uniref:Histidine phosphatase family protein n=1 Tax=Rhizomicrobium electricum TaxID=480070 RepID=A0ABP3QGU2_9PROT|nr:histidine phosphatase family protein [Rhizomicrobium electricum]NIJ49159.1 putative phosphoglycerate mutase [Rhizomicrobium electricum]
MKLALLRHGPTDWNAEGRVQGTVDTPLSAAGKAKMSALLPPAGFENAVVYCSPKLRARQTAACLGLKNLHLDPRLAEQNWGDWEGLTRAEMLARDGADAFERSGRGLAFRPPSGESTAELQARLAGFFADVAAKGDDVIAVSHMGVLRAAYVLATGWDMSAPMPAELDLKCALVLALAPDGTPSIAGLNVPLRVR